MSKIEIKDLYLIFGHEKQKALKMLKKDKSKEEILKDTGCTVGVKDANLSINEGEFFVIMGLSGSGKSTLLRCINRLIRPTAGQVLVNGVDISKISEKELLQVRRKELAMVFQNFGLLPHRSVLSNIAFGLELQGVKKEEREKKEKELEKAKKKAEKEGKEYVEPTVFLPVDVYAPGTMDIYDYISLTFTEPLATAADGAIHLKQKVDSLWNDVPYDFVPDSLNLMRYNVYADWVPGESYAFEVDSTAFHGIYGLFTDKIKKEFKVKKPEEYGQIFYNVTGADSIAFVELLDAQDKVVRTVPVVDGKADFYFLNPGKYSARLINDTNGNGVWDTGKYEDKRQPEKVYYYPQVIELKANFDLTQDWNIHEKPLDKQKPDELKKQKPDEDKKKRNQNNRSSGNNR